MRQLGLLRRFALMGALVATGGVAKAQSYYDGGYYNQPDPSGYYASDNSYPDSNYPDYNNDGSYDPGYYGQQTPPDLDGGTVDVNSFTQPLSGYGRWVDIPGYGRCWVPAQVAVGWRPYTIGHWVWTDCGWTWVTDEPWGWATYHYGRWTLTAQYGWAWLPGTVWAPAWVDWRVGDGYVGWAPLPPTRGFQFAFSVGVHDHYRVPTSWYSFCGERDFVDHDVHRRLVAVERNTTIINKTVNVTNINVVNKRVVNRGVAVEQIERVRGERIRPAAIRTVSDFRQAKSVRGSEVPVYRPAAVPRAKAVESVRVAERAAVKNQVVAPAAKRPVAPRAASNPKVVNPRTAPIPNATANPSVRKPLVTPQANRTAAPRVTPKVMPATPKAVRPATPAAKPQVKAVPQAQVSRAAVARPQVRTAAPAVKTPKSVATAAVKAQASHAAAAKGSVARPQAVKANEKPTAKSLSSATKSSSQRGAASDVRNHRR